MSDDALNALLRERAGDRCELCGATDDLTAWAVIAAPDAGADGALLACATCRAQLDGDDASVDARHWFCLQDAAWSAVPVVQVTSWRMLHRLPGEAWARDLLDQLYLDDDTLVWAKAGLGDGGGGVPGALKVVDSNGNLLADGDTVTLIKDLDVKGASFTAKRGTLVKGIRLGEDPDLVEGKVNGTAIYLKTCFLKKVG